MNIAKIIGDFFLSMWIWQITFDIVHPFLTAVIMFCVLRFVMKRKRLRSFAIAAGAQAIALFVLSAIAVGILINTVGWDYEPMKAKEAVNMMGLFKPSLLLGVVYTVIQWIWFSCGRLLWPYNLVSYFVLVVVSNGIGSIGSFLLIRMLEMSYYIG